MNESTKEETPKEFDSCWCIKRNGRYLISTIRKTRYCFSVNGGIHIKDGDEIVQIQIKEIPALWEVE